MRLLALISRWLRKPQAVATSIATNKSGGGGNLLTSHAKPILSPSVVGRTPPGRRPPSNLERGLSGSRGGVRDPRSLHLCPEVRAR